MQTNFHTKYKVECKIGEGSFSEVLKCQERSTGKSVAAKQLKKHFKSINHASEIPELMVLKKISKHPNLLELYDSYFDPSNGKVTLVFELMDMSLYDLMKTRKRPIPESRAKKFLYQIIKGIDHLHYHGIFHRDIKPENVLVKGDKVKISDMGSIKGFYSKQPYTEYISTRWYRSPECLLTKGFYGPKMDVWAMGCVYYELLTLKPLFPGADELDQISKINQVLGSPSVKLMNKLKKIKCRNLVPTFPHKKGTGLNSIIPMMTEDGRDLFKQMIVYDPDSRINVRRLLEHKYFNDIRHEEMLTQRLLPLQGMSSAACRLTTSPMWLSFITATKKRRIKRKMSHKPSMEKKIMKTQTNMAPRMSTVLSSEMSYSNKTSGSEDVDGNDIQVYSIKPAVNKEDKLAVNDFAMNGNVYNIYPDKIPGYEPFPKKKILQSLGSKALSGLGLFNKLRTKENTNSNKIITVTNPSPKTPNLKQKNEVEQVVRIIDTTPIEMEHDRNKDEYIHFNPNESKMSSKTKSYDTSMKMANRKLGSKMSGMKPTISDILPATADMRGHISPRTFYRKNITRLTDDEAINLTELSSELNSLNRPQAAVLKRFYSGPPKKIASNSSSIQCGFRNTAKDQDMRIQSKNDRVLKERKLCSVGMRSSKTLSNLNMKSKQGDMVMLQRRLEGVDMAGAKSSIFRTKL